MDPDSTSHYFDMTGDTEENSSINIYSSVVKNFRKKLEENTNFAQFMRDEENEEPKHEEIASFLKKSPKEKHTKNKKLKQCNTDEELDVICIDDVDSDTLSGTEKVHINKKNSSNAFNKKTQRLLRTLERKKQNFLSRDKSKEIECNKDEDCIVLDDYSTDSSVYISDVQYSPDHKYTAKIKWKDSIIKISMERNQKFSTVFPEIASKCFTSASCILLCLNEIKIQPEDTPKSLGMTVADILDCYVMKPSSESEYPDDNLITIQLQSGDSRKKVLLKIHKDEPLQEMMKKYSKEKDIPLKKLLFKFDGDVISPNETANDLDMEEDSCIDVILS